MDFDAHVARWTNEGKVWRVNETSLAAVVTAVPTTTAGISFWNGNLKGGKVIVALAVYAIQGGTPAALNSWGVVHQLSDLAQGTADPLPGAVLTPDVVVVNMKGNAGKYGGGLVIDIGETVLDDRWAPIGDSVNTVVISLTGTQIYTPLFPVIEIPPGAMYSLMGVGSATDVTLRIGIVFVELAVEEYEAALAA